MSLLLAEIQEPHALKRVASSGHRRRLSLLLEDIRKPHMLRGIAERRPSQPSAVSRALERVMTPGTRLNYTELLEELGTKAPGDAAGGGEEQATPTGSQDAEKPVNLKAVNAVLIEIETTEETYLTALNRLCDDFLRPLRASGKMAREDEAAIFGNCEQLRIVAQTLLTAMKPPPGADLEAAADVETRLARTALAFQGIAPYLRCFADFCAGQMAAQDRLLALSGESSLIAAILKQAEEKARESAVSLLVRPMQRLCKYPLFLKGLLKELPATHPAHDQVEVAAEAVNAIVLEINERVRTSEARQQWLQAARALSAEQQVSAAVPHRRPADRVVLKLTPVSCVHPHVRSWWHLAARYASPWRSTFWPMRGQAPCARTRHLVPAVCGFLTTCWWWARSIKAWAKRCVATRRRHSSWYTTRRPAQSSSRTGTSPSGAQRRLRPRPRLRAAQLPPRRPRTRSCLASMGACVGSASNPFRPTAAPNCARPSKTCSGAGSISAEDAGPSYSDQADTSCPLGRKWAPKGADTDACAVERLCWTRPPCPTIRHRRITAQKPYDR